MKNKYSVNPKLNNMLMSIETDIRENVGLDELKHYMKWFDNEPDFNLAQYGNLIIYYSDLRESYFKAGYKNALPSLSDEKLWEVYRRQVGFVARQIAKEEGIKWH